MRDFLTERSIKSARKDIKNILDSYHHSWDILAELLQNSHDAILRRKRMDGAFTGIVRLKLDYQNRSIEILDNGVGIERERLHELLAPGGGDKEGHEEEIGEKGVGLTFCVFSGNHFEIATRTKGHGIHGGVVTGGLDWLNSSTEVLPLLEEALPTNEDAVVRELGLSASYDSSSFTRIKISSLKSNEGEADLFARTVDEIKFILLTRTALGSTEVLWNNDCHTAFAFEFEMRLPHTGIGFVKGTLDAKFPLLHALLKKPKKLDDIIRPMSTLPDNESKYRFLRDVAVYQTKSYDHGGKPFRVYGVMYPSNKVFQNLSETKLKLSGSGTSHGDLFESGIYLATKGMPTGIRIEHGPGGRYPAYYRRCYFIVQFDGFKFDVGRKTVTNYWKAKAQQYVSELFSWFEGYAPYQKDEHFDPSMDDFGGETQADRNAEIEAQWHDAEGLVDLRMPSIPYKKQPNGQEASVAAIFH